MISYAPESPCCGVYPRLTLLNEDMRTFFASCEGGMPEAPLIDWAWSRVGHPGMLFLDIGAHVGTWAIPFWGAGMDVVAFEPNPAIYECLNRSGVRAIRAALSDHAGTGRLTAPGIDGGMASIALHYDGPVDEEVPVARLDSLHLDPAVIKIDVEGAEVDVLRGAQNTIATHHPTIFFECWEDERGQRTSEIFATLDDFGYSAERCPWPEMWIATYAWAT